MSTTTEDGFNINTIGLAIHASGESIRNDGFMSLVDGLRRVANHKEMLRNAMRTAVERLERAVSKLDAGWSVNSLGELQSSGPEVDRLCALYSASIENYVTLRHTLMRVGALDEATVVQFESNAGWQA